MAQVQAIFECVDTNWNQITVNGVTGANAPIVLFWPQAGSGTRAVITDVLGFDPTKQVAPSVCTTTTQPITGFTVASNTSRQRGEHARTASSTRTASVTRTPPAAPSLPARVTAAAIYLYSAGKFSQQWNDTTDYNSTHNNFVDQTLNGGTTNTMGNFVAGTLTMATMQNTSGTGEAYVDLTPQIGPFNQNTNRGTFAIDGNTVAEANEWYSNLPSNTGGNPSDSNATHSRCPLRLQRRRHGAAGLQRSQDADGLRQPGQRYEEHTLQR